MTEDHNNDSATKFVLGTLLPAAWRNKTKIWTIVNDLRERLIATQAENSRGILMLGPGGVGKTTFAQVLAGVENDPDGSMSKYVESINSETYTLPCQGQPDVAVLVPPGQKHRRERTWDDLCREIQSGAYCGLIFVMSYGYHSLGIRAKSHRLFRGSGETFLDDFLTSSRRDEIEIVRYLQPFLRARINSPMWLLTVVTKQDLWWKAEDAVQRHYLSGEYANAIATLVDQQDPMLFRSETAFCSLVINNFRAGEHDLLATNAEGYDQEIQFASIARLIEVLAHLMDWESQKH